MLDKLGWKKVDKEILTIEERMANLRQDDIPKHIAIIMDGNGRWAKKRALPRFVGHREGMQNIRRITRAANSAGVGAITLYAFSTENWKRPPKEVEFLMRLPEEFLNSFIPELMDLNIRVEMIGEMEGVPEYTSRAIQHAMVKTKENTGMVLNFAFNYGSRREIVLAVQQLAKMVQDGTLEPQEITEELISEYLMTAKIPDPDLLIRTSGEIRLSNFLLWQLAYTEFIFTDVHWPDFTAEKLLDSLESYQQRNRRYGGLKGE
ncbi:MAG: isoprenyl transferase [Kurthia sp.]|uniref:Isoprenyl transferase n=1 Tax=Kurthia zopfii TaxID=1650 RepID=A0A2U3AE85_9BACL|nr:isoprenyl transferase [Kurthia zopfii]PWI22761.1 isoprenyl transferase [Kurthia zopfii]TDR41802.1 undecaprenyl diphosphate synthase [Kurthia zopfii]STX09113.1 Undecaprenyl pyrophosphate synthase [Kurthia zopfii]VEI04672.1 Undecaprenyl pyrophosphate synthase [Kurthia zopfii]GEK30956.1 isoprenyl transferase [Kurthia zopfii]